MDAEIKCPFCDGGFLEQMGGSMGDYMNDDIDVGSDRALSLWAPILLRLIGGLGSSRGRIAAQEQVAGNEAEQERDFETFLRRRRGRSSSAAFSHLLQDIRSGNLLENDPNRHGSPPAQKEAVKAMPQLVLITTCNVQCPWRVLRWEVKQRRCHVNKFHNDCILPWLELHSSCPVCRYELPSDDLKAEGNGSGNREKSVGNENVQKSQRFGTGEQTMGNGRRYWIPVPWPFDGLFSLSGSRGEVLQNHQQQHCLDQELLHLEMRIERTYM